MKLSLSPYTVPVLHMVTSYNIRWHIQVGQLQDIKVHLLSSPFSGDPTTQILGVLE